MAKYKDISNLVCVAEWRYGSSEMRKIFTQSNIVSTMVRVEKALLKGLVEAGIAPREALEELESLKKLPDPEEIYKLEEKTGHDVASLVSLLGKIGPNASRWIHYGATSNDVIDTVWALLLREALGIVKKKLTRIIRELARLAKNYSDVIMVGRTHGQHALPITFGFKLANYVYELSRSYERICGVEKRLIKAKIGGAVGTMAAWGSKGYLVRDATCRELGLEPHVITTQVAPRDGFAELVSVSAIIAAQLERLALEVRELARPEIGEAWEDRSGRIGSSAMPQKANPVTAERIAGLSRMIRSFLSSSVENIVLWHERDLSNSSYERILVPHLMLLLDQVLEDSLSLLSRLRIDPERMERNLWLTRGAVMSEALMELLIRELGMRRDEAYAIAREFVSRAVKEEKSFAEIVLEDPRLKNLDKKKLFEALDPRLYLGQARRLIEDAVSYSNEIIAQC